jgi:hypothetical protein
MSTDVATRSFNVARTGANTSETTLTPAAVQTRGVSILHTLLVPDDPRLEAQPLYLSSLNVNGKVRNVIYQASMGNSVYAWDADTGDPLWKRNLGMPINGGPEIDMHLINVRWGILSTPVIDRAANTLYTCAWISSDGTGNWQKGRYFVAALDITTGGLRQPLLPLHGEIYQPGPPGTKQKFDSMERKQRAALAMVDGAVIVCFGTIMETAQSARGWMFAIDTARWEIAATWCSTSHGSGGGIWMSGAGPAIQSDGSIWVVTGNGDFDGKVDFGESVVRLRFTPKSSTSSASLKVTGSWTPWTDDGRTGGNPEGEGATAATMAHKSPLKSGNDARVAELLDLPKPSNFRLVAHLARQGIQPKNMDGAWGDQDLGASGIVLIEELGIGLVSGKDGILYTIDLANPGETAPVDLAPANVPANYAKLSAPPILYTYYDPGVNPATPNPATLNQLAGGVTHHLHGTPIYWVSASRGKMHFCGGENGNLRAWSLAPNKASNYLGCSSAYASAQSRVPPGGMPGWGITLSADGENGGIVWALIPYKDANMELTNSRLLAYDAANLGRFADGSGEIVPLWDSQAWGWNFLHPKFNRPIAVGGKVLVPTYDGRLLVLGLA